MKKEVIALIIFCFIFAMSGSVYAEPYTGKEVPSDKLLSAYYYGGYQFIKSIGKLKNGDNSYTIYYLRKQPPTGKISISNMNVFHLDTKIWIAYPAGKPEIVQNK